MNESFGWAIDRLKEGKRVRRVGWNGKGMFLMLCIPDGRYTLQSTGKTYNRRPYIYMKDAQDTLVPWAASQTDVLEEDWELAE